MPNGPQAAFEFGQFTLIPTEKRLLCGEKEIALAPKVFDTLVLLVENPGRLIRKDELLRTLWPDTVVEEVALAHNVSQLRKALSDRVENPRFIETVPKRGYRFIAPVRTFNGSSPRAPETNGGGKSSSAQHAAWSRRPVPATLAVSLVLITGVAAYVYWSRTGHGATEALPVIHSLAVLPLEDLSGGKEQEYFADGITDALTTELAQVSSLRVISRTSAMQFKNSRETLPQIGRDLRVDVVVEGTIARSEGRVRITAQLIEARSDHHLWAHTYERELRDALALQDEIARDIAEQVRGKLTSNQRGRLTQFHAVDPDAQDAYLRGRYWWHKATPEGEWRGLDYFQKAIARDPTYALAYAGVADSFVRLGHHGQLPAKEAFPKAKEAAIKALDLDPSIAEAHTSLAIVEFSSDWDWSGAEREFRQAVALNPNYATAHHWYSHYLTAMGRFDEAVKELEQAHDLDPLSLPINKFLGDALYYARRYDDALSQYRRSLEVFPDRWELYEGITTVYEQMNMFAEAFATHQQSLALTHDGQTANALAEAYRRSGYRGWVLKKIQLVEHAPELDLAPLYFAHLYAMLNDEAHTMSYLERAYDQRSPWLLYVQVDPAMDFMRSSPRFRDLVRRIGLPQ